MLPVDQRITTKERLKEWLECELLQYKCSLISRLLLSNEKAVLYSFQKTLRLCEYYHNCNKRLFYIINRIKLSRMENRYALHIPENVCNKGLKIMHIGPILINSKCIVGRNCSLHINTSLVAGGTSDEAPVINDGVVIGVGAVVLGGVTVADNIAIGANAVVNKSFSEPNIAIAGVPAKKISNNGRLEWKKRNNDMK